MPAYEVGEAIFATAGYDLQKTLSECFDKPSEVGVRVVNYPSRVLWILKILYKNERSFAKWHTDALNIAAHEKEAATVAIPVLIDAKETSQAEEHWYIFFHEIGRIKNAAWMSRLKKRSFSS